MRRLSIITINYNNIDGLRRTYDSIVSQSFHDYEWIVVDGGSTDGSKDFIFEHQSDVTWWCSERDGGIYNAQNKGLNHAAGEYLLFLNSGDTLLTPYVLEEVFSCTLDADVVYGDWYEKKSFSLCNKSRCYPGIANYFRFATCPLCHQATFIRGSVLRKSPYDETYRICADWAKWVELSKSGCSFQHIPVKICLYLRDGISYRAIKQKRQEHKRIIGDFYPMELAEILWSLMEKNNKRLRTIRRLIWVCSLLCITILIACSATFF